MDYSQVIEEISQLLNKSLIENNSQLSCPVTKKKVKI